MKNRNGIAWLIAMVAALSIVAAACGSSGGDSGSDTNSDNTTTTAGSSAMGPDMSGYGDLAGKLTAQGSSFQDTFQQAVSTDFNKAVADKGGSLVVTYTKSGSGDGKNALLTDPETNFAGTDSLLNDDEKALLDGRTVLYFPIAGGPIAVVFNVEGVTDLNLKADTIAKIFQGDITKWDDAAIKADNPDADLPSTAITVVHRSDKSGTTSNFTHYLDDAAKGTWTLGAGDEIDWPASTQGAEKNTGVTSVVTSTDGAIAYADLADAAKENLDVANIANQKDEFIAPTPDSASKALGGAEINDDLTFNPLNVDADGAYPITAPTWMIVLMDQSDEAATTNLKAYLEYILTAGQEQAKTLLYAPVPEDLAKKAIAQIDQITTK